MADAAISFLVEKVGDQLIKEATFLSGVTGQVSSFKGELEQLQDFLSKAERKRNKEEDVKKWLGRLRDSAYNGEDIIDEFVMRNELRRRRKSRFKRWLLVLRDLPSRRRIGKSIIGVSEELGRILKDKDNYSIQADQVSPPADALVFRRQRDNRPEMDGVIVGLEDQERGVVQRLTTEGDELRVVSIFGMGGLGKTTLAKKVHGNGDVQMCFERIVWVSVSQDCPPLQLLKELLKKTVGEVSGDHDTVALENMLNEWLKDKRVLIIMDDVWEDRLWTAIRPAFRGIENGSRVLLTTRFYEVAKAADPSRDPFQLRFLNDGESWELFNWKVFNSKDGCPLDLVEKGKQLLKKCKQLPLAIVILGGLLSLKAKTVMEWGNVLKTLDWRFDSQTEGCNEVLALSYRAMPSYLKPCFLYFGLFPEDAEIRSSKLKMLWIAEGFTEFRKRRNEMLSAEDIAEDYLEELYQRSLIQVVSKKSYGGSKTCGIKSCRIHDLLRDLAIAEAKEFEFLTVHGVRESNSQPKARRRLAIQCDVDEQRDNGRWLDLKASSPKLRSLLCFNQRQLNLIPIVDALKLLRVIDLKDVKIEQLPEEIGTLTYLRFLGLNNTRLKRLPAEVGNLFNLLTLDIRSNGKLSVPPTVWKMEKLRHLYLDWHAPTQIESLPNLQILNGIPAGDWISKSLAGLTSLTRLAITKISRATHENALASALPHLRCLNYLALIGDGPTFIPTGLPFKDLEDLYLLTLYGKLEKLPSDVTGFPTQLMKLTLRASKLDQDPMPVLGQLKSLESLKLLKESYIGKKMVCSDESFVKLKFLTLDELEHLEEWELEGRAMVHLKRLVISNCGCLAMLPEGLKHTSGLQELELVGMPTAFKNRVRKDGEDAQKIRRSISINLNIR
ncbi:putative disease resistance protein [Acorus calamus]|uniref:Disease resistance protein n=1 Tax=Acorus calamus TaxID=4465 RepID=A0AAV9ES75_ACOCL|nr:putative disease resistance protein [Acorus calamus]